MARPKAPPTRIQKSGSGHQYFLDGEKIPGVTTILHNGIPKPGLMSWAAGIPSEFIVERLQIKRSEATGKTHIVADDAVREALEWNATRTRPVQVSNSPLPRNGLVQIFKDLRYKDLDEAGNRGTEVHQLAHRLASGEEVDVPEALVLHVRSYLRFLEEWAPYDALVERVVINRRWRYMGRFDMLARFDNLPEWIAERIGADTGTGLVDIKTARSGIFAEVALQLEAYRRCETMLDGSTEVPMPPVDFVAAIHVRADGYDVHAFDVEAVHRPTTFDIFLYAKQVGEWLDWKEGPASTVKSPPLRPAHRQTIAS